MARLAVDRLDFYYGAHRALKAVTMAVPERRILALIGPSGCGKTTLLKVFNRMGDLVPGARAEGSVTLDGEEILGPGVDLVRLRRRVGMVFQAPNPFPFSIRGNVEYGPRLHGESRPAELERIVESALSAVGLWESLRDRLDRNAAALTPDVQQRLCVARALAVEPEVLLMDEPCSTLDPHATAELEDLMRELRERYTIVIVTHNMQQAARVSDAAGFMLLGELVEFAETAALFSRPADKRTDDYISGRYG